ncbi:MAG: hypothetical protein JXA69_17850, partial [Phycisphaerae bacterium]|nr:hypothetical protein [Phycisphaerae bacterium]
QQIARVILFHPTIHYRWYALESTEYPFSAIGVPAAPNGTGTRGLKMTANNSGGVFSGFSVSPNGQSFAGDYTVSFDMW